MKKWVLVLLGFFAIISYTTNAQSPGPLVQSIEDVVRKAGANQQGPMTEVHLLNGQMSGIDPKIKSWLDEHKKSIIGTWEVHSNLKMAFS